MEDIMNLGETLDELKRKAKKDPALRQMLLATRDEKNPLSAFCSVCRQLGYEVYEMDLIQEAEEAYAAMRRSTNGGGENSPLLSGEDDYYEMFFADL
jgi:hypothetical protein